MHEARAKISQFHTNRMPASVLLSIFLMFVIAAALAFIMGIIKKRKNTENTADPRSSHPEIQENSYKLNDQQEEILASHIGNIDNWNPHLEQAIRSISTPLNTMIGNMELIEQLDLSEDQRKRWKAIRIASDEILKKVSDTLDYCNLEKKKNTMELMDFDACEMVAKNISSFIKKAKSKNIKIHMRSAQFPVFVNNDQVRVSQMLGHLLENAIQFTNDGYIIVSIENETLDPEHRLLRIVVEDSGIGIPEELHEEIFHPFMSSTAHEGSLGLGLAICKRLCSKLDAKISVSSTPDSGSRFAIEIPCSRSFAANPRNAAYRDALKGHSCIFICAVKDWHDSIIPHLEYWGLVVDAYYDPDVVDHSRIKNASCVVFFGSTDQWSAQAENEIIAEASCIIECNESNPLEIKKAGRTILLSTYSLASLFKAFELVASSLKPEVDSLYLLPSHASAVHPEHVIEAFKKSLQASLRNIQLSITSGNGAMVIQELHNLSGSFAAFNDPDFSRRCIQLEKRIKMEGLSPAIPAIKDLMQLLRRQLE